MNSIAFDAIQTADEETAYGWWREMNMWRWPESLPGMPENFYQLREARDRGQDRYSIIMPLMAEIQRRFPTVHKARSEP